MLKNKKSEVDLAAECISFLRDKYPSCEIYQEVVIRGRRTVDIVCVIDTNTFIAIECKLNFNLEVIYQGDFNKEFFHQSYICIPESKLSNGKWVALKICKAFDIGVIEVEDKVGSKFVHVPPLAILKELPKVFEQQKHWKKAGDNKGVYFSKFQNTVKNIIVYLLTCENNKNSLREIVLNIEHHYSNRNSAISSLRAVFKRRDITGVWLEDIRQDIVYLDPTHKENLITKYGIKIETNNSPT